MLAPVGPCGAWFCTICGPVLQRRACFRVRLGLDAADAAGRQAWWIHLTSRRADTAPGTLRQQLAPVVEGFRRSNGRRRELAYAAVVEYEDQRPHLHVLVVGRFEIRDRRLQKLAVREDRFGRVRWLQHIGSTASDRWSVAHYMEKSLVATAQQMRQDGVCRSRPIVFASWPDVVG